MGCGWLGERFVGRRFCCCCIIVFSLTFSPGPVLPDSEAVLAGLGAEGGGGRGGEAGGGGGAGALNTVEHWPHWGATQEEQQGAEEQ